MGADVPLFHCFTTAATAMTAINFTNPVAEAQISANLARLGGTNLFTGTNTFSSAVIATNPANQLAGAFSGNAGGLKNLNLAQAVGALAGAFKTGRAFVALPGHLLFHSACILKAPGQGDAADERRRIYF